MNTSSPRTHHVGSRRAPWAQLLGSLVTATPLLALGFALGPAALAGPLDKNPVKNPNLVPVQENHPMYLGTVTSGVKTSDVYTEGNFSIVAPVFSTLGADATLSGDVIYLEPTPPRVRVARSPPPSAWDGVTSSAPSPSPRSPARMRLRPAFLKKASSSEPISS
ncbi:hypothetical protein [Verrucomicrobium spinosum]|uniref:hypothetical protein n=1 Tax=Verrucomicrobium spinosum TaxID=2736 RepID=UPI0012E1B1E6|nr:hypothetical protein [Verrucomicrobium spinosum]